MSYHNQHVLIQMALPMVSSYDLCEVMFSCFSLCKGLLPYSFWNEIRFFSSVLVRAFSFPSCPGRVYMQIILKIGLFSSYYFLKKKCLFSSYFSLLFLYGFIAILHHNLILYCFILALPFPGFSPKLTSVTIWHALNFYAFEISVVVYSFILLFNKL